MYTKLIVVIALTSVTAQDHHKDNNKEHAYSSQSFVLHQSHGPASAHNDNHHYDQQVELHHGQNQNDHHGHQVVHQHGHKVEHHHGHHEESHGHYEDQHHEEQNHGLYQNHHEESHGNNNEHYHGHNGISSQSVHLHNDGHLTKHVEYYGHPKYNFAYEVKDPHTHDEKFQHESRDGDLVKGVYGLHQPDGRVRIVKYHADKKSGFNADVKYEGHAVHAAPEHKDHH